MHGMYKMTHRKWIVIALTSIVSAILFIYNHSPSDASEVLITNSKIRYSISSGQRKLAVSYRYTPMSVSTQSFQQVPVEPMKLNILSSNQIGAVCLDGTPPAIYTRPGQGKGVKSWIIHLQGGYRCINEADCLARSINEPIVSSSKGLPDYLPSHKSEGILSPDSKSNPLFFNWNVAYVPYCDGGAFLGNRDEPLFHEHTGVLAYLRGRRIAREAFGFLRARGLENADRIIISGCGSSSLGALLNLEMVKNLPRSVKIRLLLDGGFIFSAGTSTAFHSIFNKMFEMNNMNEYELVSDCYATPNLTKKEDCIFMNNLLARSSQETMVMTSFYDPWQLVYLEYVRCYSANCLSQLLLQNRIGGMQWLRRNIQHFVQKLKKSNHVRFYQTSCLQECVSLSDKTWNKILVNGTTPSEAVFKWMEHGTGLKEYTDCGSPQCNSRCPVL